MGVDKKDTGTVAFLKELAELSNKYRLTIHGCGCCGSPFLVAMKLNETVETYVLDEDDNADFLKPKMENEKEPRMA